MATQAAGISKPYPNPYDMTSEEFEASMAAYIPQQAQLAEDLNAIALEVNVLSVNAESAAGAIANSVWVSGTTYAVGDVRYSPIDFLNYRRKTAGAGTTDPSADTTNWVLLIKTGAGGADATSSAADVTLTSTGGRLQIITMTAASKKVTLPPATGLNKGSPIFVIRNAGLYRFALHKNGGAFICYVSPGKVVALSCSDTGTASGIWHSSGQNDEKTFDGNAAEVLNAVDSRYITVAMLTATKAICAYINNATGFVNVVVVNFGSASGTSVAINAEASKDVSIAAQTSSQATVVYKTSAGITKGCVIDVSGNTPTGGTVATIDTGPGSNGTSLTALSSTQLLCAYCDAGTKERILDIASSAITPSGEVVADATAASQSNIRVKKIASAKAIYCFRGSSQKNVYARLQSVTGSTPAPTGSVLQIAAPGFMADLEYGVAVLNASRAIVAQSLDRQYADMIITLLDISGLTPVVIRNKLLNVGLIAAASVDAVQTDSNNAYVSWTGGVSLGVDSMTVTVTNDDQMIISQVAERLEPNVTASAGYLSCAALDATHVMQLSRNASTFLSAKVIEIAS